MKVQRGDLLLFISCGYNAEVSDVFVFLCTLLYYILLCLGLYVYADSWSCILLAI